MSEYLAHVTDVAKKEDLLNGLEFCDWKNQVKTEDTVFIKPNFTFPYFKEGITTHPELLKNLLEIIKDRADNVIVCKSDVENITDKFGVFLAGGYLQMRTFKVEDYIIRGKK